MLFVGELARQSSALLSDCLLTLTEPGQMIGFLSAGVFNGLVTERWGLGKVIAMGGIIQACGYVFLIPGFPFPVMPCCYAVIGRLKSLLPSLPASTADRLCSLQASAWHFRTPKPIPTSPSYPMPTTSSVFYMHLVSLLPSPRLTKLSLTLTSPDGLGALVCPLAATGFASSG